MDSYSLFSATEPACRYICSKRVWLPEQVSHYETRHLKRKHPFFSYWLNFTLNNHFISAHLLLLFISLDLLWESSHSRSASFNRNLSSTYYVRHIQLYHFAVSFSAQSKVLCWLVLCSCVVLCSLVFPFQLPPGLSLLCPELSLAPLGFHPFSLREIPL